MTMIKALNFGMAEETDQGLKIQHNTPIAIEDIQTFLEAFSHPGMSVYPVPYFIYEVDNDHEYLINEGKLTEVNGRPFGHVDPEHLSVLQYKQADPAQAPTPITTESSQPTKSMAVWTLELADGRTIWCGGSWSSAEDEFMAQKTLEFYSAAGPGCHMTPLLAKCLYTEAGTTESTKFTRILCTDLSDPRVVSAVHNEEGVTVTIDDQILDLPQQCDWMPRVMDDVIAEYNLEDDFDKKSDLQRLQKHEVIVKAMAKVANHDIIRKWKGHYVMVRDIGESPEGCITLGIPLERKEVEGILGHLRSVNQQEGTFVGVVQDKPDDSMLAATFDRLHTCIVSLLPKDSLEVDLDAIEGAMKKT